MSEDKLVFSTQKSLYDPIKIEIDGQTYQSKKLTRVVITELDELDKKLPFENDEILYKIVQFLFDVDLEILEKLDKREVQNIYVHVKTKIAEVDKERVKLIRDTFEKISGIKNQPQVKETIPKNRKRPGNKA